MTPRDRTAAALVSLALAVSAFAIGSAPRWAACLTAALSLATVVPLVRSRRYLDQRPLLLSFLAIAAAMTLLQLIPLPASIVGVISPDRLKLVGDNAKAWGTQPPAMMSLSYDAPGTMVELAKLAGYLAFAYTCLWLSTSSRGRKWLLTTVVLVGGAMALTAIAHHLVGARKLFGIYEPHFAPPKYMAPLLNPNHLAGLLAFCAPVALGLAVSSIGSTRATWIGIGLLCAGVAFLTESRAGAISLCVGTAVAGVLVWRQRRKGLDSGEIELPRHMLVPAIVIGACIVALLVAFTAGGVAQELSKTTTTQLTGSDYKLEAWRASKDLMTAHPWTGIGRGAFEYAFTRVHPSGSKTYSHVENEYLQAVLDWGFPVAMAMGVLLCLMALRISRRTLAGPLEAGAIGGLVALALHNFVDFNLEFAAVAMPALVGFTVLLPGKPRETRSPTRKRILKAGGLVAGAAAVALASLPLGRIARDEAEALDADIKTADTPIEKGGQKIVPPIKQELVDRAQALTERHPSDYIGFGLAAQTLFRKGDSRAVDVVNRALDLNPDHSGLHWLAAQMLESTDKGRNQALVEYGLSVKTAADPRPILADMLSRFPDAATAAKALPDDPTLAENIADQLSILQRDDVALAYVKAIHDHIPDNADVAGLVADYAIKLKQSDVALVTAKQAFDHEQNGRNSARWGRALSLAGRNDEAEKMLSQAILQVRSRGTRDDLISLLTILGDVQRLRNELDQAKETLTSALELATDSKGLAAIHRVLAQVEDALGNPTTAAVERTRAEQLDPTPPAPDVVHFTVPLFGEQTVSLMTVTLPVTSTPAPTSTTMTNPPVPAASLPATPAPPKPAAAPVTTAPVVRPVDHDTTPQ